MLPPIDSTWTWDAWAEAQREADPWKEPNTREEVAIMVRRGHAAGFRLWEMEHLLQVPSHEIEAMLSEPASPDPFREEIEALFSQLQIEATVAKVAESPFPGTHAALYDRFIVLQQLTYTQLELATEIADPETIVLLKRAQERELSEQRLVERYFDLLGKAFHGTLQFPPPNLDGQIGTRETRVGFQVISAILESVGLSWLPGYPPRVTKPRIELERLVLGYLKDNPVAASLKTPLKFLP